MKVHFACPHCGADTVTDDRNAGRQGVCDKCHSVVIIPRVQPGVHSPTRDRRLPAIIALLVLVVLVVAGAILGFVLGWWN